ncbi:MAG: NB-ARC domain-containing protein, partial [Candidatus Hydrogenedentota bacterium]
MDQRDQSVQEQANLAVNKYEATRDITKIEGDVVDGDKVLGDKTVIISQPLPPSLQNHHQISDPVGDFVGRESEICALLAAFDGLGSGAVISGVRGMGGVGKTELAKAVARRIKPRFPDGHIAFNLRGASNDASSKPATPAEALQHVVRAFHPDARLPEEIDQLQGLYHSALEGKRVLLLMDNALKAQQLAPLVPPPDGCGLIVTSRHHFTLPNMTVVDVNSLPPAKAQELLVKICPRIDAHAAALAERCGHLPLALRLAASALKSRPTLRIEDFLNDLSSEKKRLATLDAYKGSTDEERGIEASLAISYRLLEPP